MITGKTIVITGASRGIGKAIATKMASMGNNLVIAAKTTTTHSKLEGTIHETVEECKNLGSNAIAVKLDVREKEDINNVVQQARSEFGGIDILINNASAVSNSSTDKLKLNKFNLMNEVNYKGTFLMTQACLPDLLKSSSPHVLNMSPPLDLNPEWFELGGTAYTISKYNMSMCALGMSQEFKNKIAFNCLWPKTLIATAAVNMLAGSVGMKASRKPDIMADAATWILSQDKSVSGNFFIDEEVITNEIGDNDLNKYSNTILPIPLMQDLYVGNPDNVRKLLQMSKLMTK